MKQKSKFDPVDPKQDFVEMEKQLLKFWQENKIVEKYLEKNKSSHKKFSFLDGPITANNPMGVHHAWGRTYKDLFQRFHNMIGDAGRFQNGFDEQGLWVEVEVEKELGFKNKKDIEKFGIDKFVNLCKARVKKFSEIQTRQSQRLGYFMDWDNSYHTSSDENNYAIWNFLKVCHQKGYLYKGRDSVPWCPRCGTAISQHEILQEEYKQISHKAVFVKYQLNQKPETGNQKLFLLVWTTTAWTLPSNVAIAVNPNLKYGVFNYEGSDLVIELTRAKAIGIESKPKKTLRGKELTGLSYQGNFDELESLKGVKHRIIEDKDFVTAEEGTGLVHIAPGAGEEDFKLAQVNNLPVIESIDEEANYLGGFGDLAGKNAKKNPDLIFDKLQKKAALFKIENYKHRYPICWRCKTELVWRVVDEWYIAMDKKDPQDAKKRTLRQQLKENAKKINWIPAFGLDRELDWLKNMHDWLISKKRYWGLTLPIWECDKCQHFVVIGSKEELKQEAVNGWDKFKSHSPHRPWIDEVQINCPKCKSLTKRIKDVGNPWLDAGIVSLSTMPKDWFPADFITESFPGQFKNWFYSLLTMSTVLTGKAPFKSVLGFASLLDEKGEEMHKSKGNAIEFNEAADKIGVDVMRWMYVSQNPASNLLFGYHKADEVRKKFYLILWNCYKFFIDYANLAGWNCDVPKDIKSKLTILDKWILAKLTKLTESVNKSIQKYDSAQAARNIEEFIVKDLSTWYIRGSRIRVGPTAQKNDQEIFLSTLYGVLVTLSKLLAPFTPFIAEQIYKNLTNDTSVHLSNFPQGDGSLKNEKLIREMNIVRKIVEESHAIRKEKKIKVRQPLNELFYSDIKLESPFEQIIARELNIKKITYKKDTKTKLDLNITPLLKQEGEAREIIRSIQQARKEAGCNLDEQITITLTSWPKRFEEEIKRETLVKKIEKGSQLKINRL